MCSRASVNPSGEVCAIGSGSVWTPGKTALGDCSDGYSPSAPDHACRLRLLPRLGWAANATWGWRVRWRSESREVWSATHPTWMEAGMDLPGQRPSPGNRLADASGDNASRPAEAM
jgi:hypothetical protein